MRRRCQQGLTAITMLFGLGVVALLCFPASAAELTKNPIMRIESGAHTAFIRSAALLNDKQELITVSEDKTIRVWSLDSPDKEPRTLRIPLGHGREGMLYCVAAHDEKNVIAVGGWTGWDWDERATVYLLNPENGEIAGLIPDLPHRPIHLEFSPDGESLAVCLKGGEGVRWFETKGWTLIGSDQECEGDVYDAHYDPTGRLATVAFDGKLRLYASDQNKLKETTLSAGQRPVSCSFSPDGKFIAVAFADSNLLEVVSSETLEHEFYPDAYELSGGSFGTVSWSKDGKTLWAGGRFFDPETGEFPVVRWQEKGWGSVELLPGARDTVTHLVPLPDNSLTFTSADAGWGVLSSNGELIRTERPLIPDFRNQTDKLLVSDNGETIRIGLEPRGRFPVEFSLRHLHLETDLFDDGNDLQSPLMEGLSLLGWRESRVPSLNGEVIPLTPGESSHCYTKLRSSDSFLLGGTFHLYHFDEKGELIWQQDTPGPVRALNTSSDGRIGVGAFGDGIVRWFRIADGETLLNLFIARNRNSEKIDWICWSPTGYYAASAGADTRIGWHLNRARDRSPDFYRFGQFRDLFFRDDIIRRILPLGSEAGAVKQANLVRQEKDRPYLAYPIDTVQPPGIKIVQTDSETKFDSDELTIRYEVSSPSGLPVSEVRAFVDGAAVAADRGVNLSRVDANAEALPEESFTARSITIPVPPRDCQISLVAAAEVDDFASMESWPSTLSMTWNGSEKKAGGILHLLTVGVSEYQDEAIQDLAFCDKDAKDFAALLTQQDEQLYERVEITELVQKTATRDEIIRSMMVLSRKAGPDDTVAIFIAGHGINDGLGRYFFLPFDTDSTNLDESAVSDVEILRLLQGISGRRLCFIDTCHSGNVFGGARQTNHDLSQVVSSLASPLSSVIVFASSTANLKSYESTKWQNGAFTKAVVSGVEGEADIIRDQKITVDELGLFITTEVKRLTEGKQIPVRQMPLGIPDFVFALP